MTFQRARTEEQREIRRRAILDMASAMLDEMPVAAVTLNELSRRVGLAKPNVLRYFESREAVLLELLDHFLQEWLTELAGELAAGIDENLPMAERAAAVVAITMFHGLAVGWADLVLPGTSYLERDGTYVNLEGRVQRLRRTVIPPGPDELAGILRGAGFEDVRWRTFAGGIVALHIGLAK